MGTAVTASQHDTVWHYPVGQKDLVVSLLDTVQSFVLSKWRRR